MTKRNAIIMAAGTSSRFVPLSVEIPKGLVDVKGEILIERQIRQLIEAGVEDITLIVGYKAEMFSYFAEKYGLSIVVNEDYWRYNNTSSLIRVLDKLDNTFICCSDNYYIDNVFLQSSDVSYYSALYVKGDTCEYCLTVNADDQIEKVNVGGRDSWYMVGHAYFNHDFSLAFRQIMAKEYENEETKRGYWEDVYIRYINQLPKMKINRYGNNEIKEFDTLDELRLFDESYCNDTRSSVVKQIAEEFGVEQSCIHAFENVKHEGDYLLFRFMIGNEKYEYNAENRVTLKKI